MYISYNPELLFRNQLWLMVYKPVSGCWRCNCSADRSFTTGGLILETRARYTNKSPKRSTNTPIVLKNLRPKRLLILVLNIFLDYSFILFSSAGYNLENCVLSIGCFNVQQSMLNIQ